MTNDIAVPSAPILDSQNEVKTDVNAYQIPTNFEYEPEVVPVAVDTTVEKPKDIRTVINLIRNSSKDIENLGFNIEIEEIDFENSYQVIFKIEK